MPPADTLHSQRSRGDRMSFGETSGPIYPYPTQKSRYRYFFYDKHHGRGAPDAAQWLPSLSQEEEFAIFDDADFRQLADDRGWLYGLRRDPDGDILELGTWGQQMAEYPYARENEPWHGYPLWPLKEIGPENRRGEKHRPAKAVFMKMEEEGLLTTQQRKRLYKGDHA